VPVGGPGATPTITNSGGDGITLAGGVNVGGLTVDNPTSGAAMKGTNVTAASIGASVSLLGGTGGGLVLSGGNGDIQVPATINTAAGHSVSISGRAGGTVALSGPITDKGTGISLANNGGSTINFSGPITVTLPATSTAQAFSATGGGTISATNSGSALTSDLGTALNVSNTSIGAGGLTFASVSAGDAGGGPANGIALSGTGTAGGLTVNGGTIQHTTGSGILATGLHSLTLKGTTVQNAGNAGVQLTNTGDLTLDAETDTFKNNFSDGLWALGTSGGTFALTVKNNTFTGNTGTGVNLSAQSGATTGAPNFDVESNNLQGQQGNAINVVNSGTGVWSGHVLNNTVGTKGTPDSGSKAGSGINVEKEFGGKMWATISGNSVFDVRSLWGINGSIGNGTGTLNLTITSNTVDMQQNTSQDAININSGTVLSDTSTICLTATGNKSTGAGTIAGNGVFDASGFAVIQNTPSAHFNLPGYAGGSTDDAAVVSFLEGANTLTGAGLQGGAFAQHNSAPGSPGFTGGSCEAAPPARDFASPAKARHSATAHRGARKSTRTAMKRSAATRPRHPATRTHTRAGARGAKLVHRSAAALRRIAALERSSVSGGGQRPRAGR
jgi:hypothetical protein